MEKDYGIAAPGVDITDLTIEYNDAPPRVRIHSADFGFLDWHEST
jgi:hypothetical protein